MNTSISIISLAILTFNKPRAPFMQIIWLTDATFTLLELAELDDAVHALAATPPANPSNEHIPDATGALPSDDAQGDLPTKAMGLRTLFERQEHCRLHVLALCDPHSPACEHAPLGACLDILRRVCRVWTRPFHPGGANLAHPFHPGGANRVGLLAASALTDAPFTPFIGPAPPPNAQDTPEWPDSLDDAYVHLPASPLSLASVRNAARRLAQRVLPATVSFTLGAFKEEVLLLPPPAMYKLLLSFRRSLSFCTNISSHFMII